MKIGLDISPLQVKSHRGRGIGRYTEKLLQGMLKVGAEHEYMFFNAGREFQVDKVEIMSTGSPSKVFGFEGYDINPFYQLALNQFLLPLRSLLGDASLLHFPTHLGAPMWMPSKKIVTVLDLIQHHFPEKYLGMFRSRAYMYCSMLSAKQADGIITISEASKRDIIRIYGVEPEKVKVTHLGVDQNFYERNRREALEELHRRYKLPDDFILYVGGFDFRKNLNQLISAYSEARKEHHIKHCLVIVGNIPEKTDPAYEDIRKVFHEVEKYGLSNEVIFPGFVPDEDLPLFYSAADIFVFTSLYEGFGLPPLEAMACGTPVIAYHCSSIPEVVSDAGILLEPGDSSVLADAISRLLADQDLREQLREKGLKRARLFTWENTARMTLQAYAEVLGSRETAETLLSH